MIVWSTHYYNIEKYNFEEIIANQGNLEIIPDADRETSN